MIEKLGYTIEDRAAQIRACCKTIAENADKIAEGLDYPLNREIIINIPARELPTITIRQEFYSERMLSGECD